MAVRRSKFESNIRLTGILPDSQILYDKPDKKYRGPLCPGNLFLIVLHRPHRRRLDIACHLRVATGSQAAVKPITLCLRHPFTSPYGVGVLPPPADVPMSGRIRIKGA